ncbi:threonine/serine exporter family protein [Floccifex sp.]|uniref:threonine/serine exporter family protein n=1 Tax=Floccifex sp. TaxID=2815810 RepID=UPI002A74DAAB|nr:threonine/serine exporter family protein [Floccifex sp.]MDD7282164.1 threonine/serine exporter family protein [Erysipelotrichaceae bacterium]MDY2959057.1 threonine/serine exporter family protein [Floccifex sp.]
MEIEKLLDIGTRAGRLLLESGAEVYRVEDTMIRICTALANTQEVDSYVTSTGIMLSIGYEGQVFSKICRVRSRNVNLNCVVRINALSRDVQKHDYTLDEISSYLDRIEKEPKYSIWMTTLFGGIGAAGFALFFEGGLLEIITSFLIGVVVRLLISFLSMMKMNDFINNVLASIVLAFLSIVAVDLVPSMDVNILIVSGIMLLVPGLAFTNAIRDTIAGDYLSGVSRIMETFVCAGAIALGVFVVFSVV